jgi:hypothetical protein
LKDFLPSLLVTQDSVKVPMNPKKINEINNLIIVHVPITGWLSPK